MIKLIHGDTAKTPYSTGTWGSRCMIMSGGAVAAACDQLAERVKRIGASLLQAKPDEVRFEEGGCRRPESGAISVAEIARIWYRRPQELPADVDPAGLEVTAGYKAKRDTGTFSYAAHAAPWRVDPVTGEVEILDYVIVEDGGVLVNPMIVDGQIYGGTRARHRHGALRRDGLRRARPATRLDLVGLSAARPDRNARDSHLPYGDAFALYALRPEGHRRGRRDRAAGRDHQRHQ